MKGTKTFIDAVRAYQLSTRHIPPRPKHYIPLT